MFKSLSVYNHFHRSGHQLSQRWNPSNKTGKSLRVSSLTSALVIKQTHENPVVVSEEIQLCALPKWNYTQNQFSVKCSSKTSTNKAAWLSASCDLFWSRPLSLGSPFLHLIDFSAWDNPSITSPRLVFMFAIMSLSISYKWNTLPI